MNQIKPFQEQGHYTEFHNLILRCVMPKTSANAWKVLTHIISQTKGWGKTEDEISYRQIKEGTGIKSDATVATALKQLVKMRCIKRRRGSTQFDAISYQLNRDFTLQDLENYLAGKSKSKADATSKIEVDDATPEIKVATSKNEVAATTEIKAATTSKIKDTKESEEHKANCECEGGWDTRPPTRPDPDENHCVLQPPPTQAQDTLALAEICNVNLRHPDERDAKHWRGAIETVRAAMPDVLPEERATALHEFNRRWRAEGKSSPYLSQVKNQWSRVMSTDPIEAQHGKNHTHRLENGPRTAIERAEERGRHRVEQLENLTEQRVSLEERRAELEARKREMAIPRAA